MPFLGPYSHSVLQVVGNFQIVKQSQISLDFAFADLIGLIVRFPRSDLLLFSCTILTFSAFTDLIGEHQIYLAVHFVCLFMKRKKENFWCTFPCHCTAHAQGNIIDRG